MADTPKNPDMVENNSTQKDTAKDIYGAGTKTFYDTIGNYIDKNGADATSKSVVGKVGGTVGNAWDIIEGTKNAAEGNHRDATGNVGSILGGTAGGVLGGVIGGVLGGEDGVIPGGVIGAYGGGKLGEEAFKKAYDDVASVKKSVDDYLTQPPANQPFNNNNKALDPTNERQPNYPNVDKTQPPQTLRDILGLTNGSDSSSSIDIDKITVTATLTQQEKSASMYLKSLNVNDALDNKDGSVSYLSNGKVVATETKAADGSITITDKDGNGVKIASDGMRTDIAAAPTTTDITDGAYVASVSAYGKGSNSSADSTATPQESVSEAGGVELTYAQLKSLSSYADKNNISLENTFQNIKQESNQAVSYINTDGNKISVSPEGNYTITTTSDEGVTQYFAYTKDSALLYKSSSVTLSDGSTLTKVFDADGKLTTTELTKIDTVGNKTTTITDVTKGTTTIMSVGDDSSVNEYEVPNSKPLESSMPDIDIAKFMDEQLSRFDKEDTTNIKEQGHYANSGAIKSDGTSGGGNTSTDTPITDTTLSNTLTPSQYSSLSEFMNSKGDVDLTPANVGGSIVFKDIDGNTVSELHVDDSGIAKYTDSSGNSTFITEQGQTLNSDEYIRYRGEQALGVVNLANSFIGLQNWANETNLQKVAALASIYNQIDHLGSVTGASTDNLPGELGGVVAGLGLAMAIESGDTVGIVTSGLVFAEAVSGGAISSALGGTPVGTVVGAINMVNALQHGDTVGAISSGLMAIAPYCGPYAPLVMIAAIAISAIFGGGETPDLPMSEGHARAIWDEDSSSISVITDQDSHNGGPTANGWMSNMLSSVQTYLAGQVDTSGNPAYELIPARLPSIGFIYDPDGFNYSSATGHLTLTWTDGNGASQTRYYNGQGSRMDGTSVEGMRANNISSWGMAA